MEKPLISVVAPCYNEEEVLVLFIQELTRVFAALPAFDFELILVDDGSTDNTTQVIRDMSKRDPRIRCLSFARNFGHQVALSAGLDYASGEATIMMDSDLQHPPDVIAQMLAAWQAGYEFVSAVRDHTEGIGPLKRLSSACFYWLFNALSDTQLAPGAADFCLIAKPVKEAIHKMPEKHRFLRGMLSWVGFRQKIVHYRANRRPAGRSKYTGVKMLGLARDAVFSFSAQPMRIATRIGAAVALSGTFYLTYIVTRHFLLGDLVPGWASAVSSILIVGGVILLFLGVMGEYIARVFEEVKGRPLYIVRGTINLDQPTHDATLCRKCQRSLSP